MQNASFLWTGSIFLPCFVQESSESGGHKDIKKGVTWDLLVHLVISLAEAVWTTYTCTKRVAVVQVGQNKGMNDDLNLE